MMFVSHTDKTTLRVIRRLWGWGNLNDFTTISHFYRAERSEYIHTRTGTTSGTTPGTTPHTAPPEQEEQQQKHKLPRQPPAIGNNLAPAHSFASPRPHARHARHEPKPKSISRLLSPPNLQSIYDIFFGPDDQRPYVFVQFLSRMMRDPMNSHGF